MVPASVLQRWSRFAHTAPRPFGTGLINKTFLLERAEPGGTVRAVLQRLHPVFAGSVNEDIDAVTRHLERKGLATPRVLPADDGALFVLDDEARPWRALSYVDGTSVDRVESPARARGGALLVARFHHAVADLDWSYRHVRVGVHDTQKHLATLETALARHATHRLFAAVEPLAHALLEAGARLPSFAALPERHCHGDLKISNVLFDAQGAGLCLVDLDTLGRMSWPCEMGDALRSWCNPAGEDVNDARVDLEIFRAAVSGYAEGGGAALVTREEWDHLVDGLATICTELAARFLADALNESYFGWDSTRFATRGEHCWVRAQGQWALARSVHAARGDLERVVDAARTR